MSSPYNKHNPPSPRSPGSQHEFSIPSTIDRRSIYQEKRSLYGSSPRREKEVGVLDIANIDHEAIQNDFQLRDLSYNKGAFNEDMDDFDYFDELEDLENDKEEEMRFLSSLRQSQLDTPMLSPSYATQINGIFQNQTSDDSLPQVLDNNNSNNTTTATTMNTEQEKMNWKEIIVFIYHQLLRACFFILFMGYWIIEAPAIRTVTLFTMIVSTLIVDPLLFLWSTLPANENWMPSPVTRKRITSGMTFIVFLLICIPSYKYVQPHLPDSLASLKTYLPSPVDYFSFKKNPEQSNSEFVRTIHSLQEEVKKIQADVVQFQADIVQHEIVLNRHEAILNNIEHLVQDAIKDKLPRMIFVDTDKHGKLQLSQAFFTYFQDSSFWTHFLHQNEIKVQELLNQHIDTYLQQQQKEGVIMTKEIFMKLLSDTLMPFQQENLTDLSFKHLIDSALTKYHQDVLNTADFALESRGASTIFGLTSATWFHLPAWLQSLYRFAGLPITTHAPEMALSPQTHVGECWRMAGDSGTLGISLSEKIFVKGFVLEFPSHEVLNDMSSAPKEIEVFGILDYRKNSERWSSLGLFTYDIHKGEPIQQFDLLEQPIPFSMVLIKIKSNWGHHHYTDLYRVRVHGDPL
ncbi:UNC-like C-terminal-domain-containing protein [Pilaira anomala]|nr:UNC-like C-terminal-domain-containing protein [Pilaira anomala]